MINFHVVGVPYQGPAAMIMVQTAEVGQVVKLRPEPDNPVDVLAVGVYLDDVRIGYVPNKGVSCKACFQPTSLAEDYCRHCGCRELMSCGLAGRLVLSGKLDNEQYTAYISGTDAGAKDGGIRCTVLVD